MDKSELVAYWVDTADRDFQTMINLYTTKDYQWSLFIGHLVIEKLLKAVFLMSQNDNNPPKTHDLLIIADKAGIKTTEKQKDLLDMITAFNISARYPDYKLNFYKKCTEEFTKARMAEIKELREWLKSLLDHK